MKAKSRAKKVSTSSVVTKPKSTSVESPKITPFNWLVIIFACFFIANLVTVYVASLLFPSNVVLGTNLLSPFTALLYSMVAFTFIAVGALPVIEITTNSLNYKLADWHWMVIYYSINFVGLWVVARFAEMLGMGLSSWMVAAVLAFIVNFAQGMIIKSMPSDMA